ncbi:hypothetical protein E8E13_004876 [Curvularia kusanoi]|uniref:Rhodopsin domain-containing protein n=1 Tax=Curvularia kusanoi TaxID=90978 RepID=A0A9P4TIT1_CURKU|nr:hypothetical protein E8E13_004876 [Curvularia kusanoi]
MADTYLQTLAYAVAYVTFAIGLSTAVLRVYCRRFMLKAWGTDDNIALFVIGVSCGQQVILHLFLHAGCGLHIDAISAAQQLQILKILFIEELYYYFVHFTIKFAFLTFYLRLSPDKTFRRLVFFGMAINVAMFIINDVIACLQCVPFDEILHPGTHPDAKCIPKLALLVVPSVLNIVTDIYILILPISTVINLQMSLRRKVAVLSVISSGASAVLVACFRLIPLFELNSSPDFSYVLGKMVIVAAIEIQLAIVAVNLPSLKALWTKVTGGSSAGSARNYARQKAYKLSALSSKGKSDRVSRGTITRMEHNVPHTESEEELFKQAELRRASPNPDVGITVTREVTVADELRSK